MVATVDFKNAPSWAKISVDDNGGFKKLQVKRSTRDNSLAGNGGAGGEHNQWAYCGQRASGHMSPQ